MKNKKFILKVLFFLVIVGIVILSALVCYAYFSPKINVKKSNQMYIYDNNNKLIYTGSTTKKWADIKNISNNVLNAFIASEDKNFYKHKGFDVFRIMKALFINGKSGKIVQGASTISQQYIKNLYLDFDKTWSRKLEEAVLTLNLEMHYDKDEILEGYLNTINYGQGNYGIEDAANYYFNKSAKDLNLDEAIILAAIPKNPSKFNPVTNLKNTKKRGKYIASKMLEQGYITDKDYKNLFKNDIQIYGKRTSNNLNTLMYYQDEVIKELENIEEIPSSLAKTGNLKIYTNLNMDVQTTLENSINSYMLDDETEVAAMVINPQDGSIIALSGGRDYQNSQFNRATQAKRQVGSTMKPILYYAALENGLTAATTFRSQKTSFVFSNNEIYNPQNYNNIYGNQNITMAAAIAYSDNIYAIKTHMFLGNDTLVKEAQKMGIKAKLQNNVSLPLGTNEISMSDFANAYTTLASGGYKRNLHYINKVESDDGATLYEYKNYNNLLLDPNCVYILNELLTSTYNSNFINYNKPTALSIQNQISHKYALKSGSTGNDYWTIGYNKNVLTLVWNGNDKGGNLNSKYSRISKNIWASTSEKVLENLKEDSWYEVPKNIVAVPLNPITGEYDENSKTLFYFINGTQPTY